MKLGSFNQLAINYNKYRPSYNQNIVKQIFSKLGKKLIVMDVGCGTGIFTKLLLKQKNIKNIYAVDPSNKMLAFAQKNLKKHKKIIFKKSSAENINFTEKLNIITSASSFHWYKKKAIKRFSSSLKKGGLLILAWNPRITERSKDEKLIQKLLEDKFNVTKRYSSGRNYNKINIKKIFNKSNFKLIYHHQKIDKRVIKKKNYIGAWMSVNDIKVQLANRFDEFLNDIVKILKNKKNIDVYYQTKIFVLKKIK